MGTAHDQTYQSGGQKIRVQPRSHTLSPVDSPDKQSEEANAMSSEPRTATRANTQLEVMGEEEETETGGIPPLDRSGILLAGAWCKCGPMSTYKTQ